MPPPILTINLPGGLSFDMIYVEGGEFLMGDDKSEYEDEKPAHRAKVSSFYLGKYQVTQAVWQTVMGENPSGFNGENRPVEQVSWDDVQNFIKEINKITNQPLRLPTEAEWEYAARGGIYSQGFTYSGSDKLKQVGWYNDNSNNETHDVGLLLANELGIYDMSGNVWEWCEDWFDEKYYEKSKKQGLAENPRGPEQGVYRVIRGGSYFYVALYCRPSIRNRGRPGYRNGDIGFRLCLSLQSVG